MIASLEPALARADGDPASDVLAAQALFLPWDAHLPAKQQAQLSALTEAAAHDGHPLRVALIASAADLGSVTGLWRRPQTYAEFLAEELSLVYHGPLLVVMPNGFGLEHVDLSRASVRAVLAGIPVPHDGAELGDDTLTAVERLAGATGHPLKASRVTVRIGSGSADTVAWIVFAVGGLLIALAWAASLRSEGLRSRGKSSPA